MKTHSPLHTHPQLKQLAGEFEHWRRNRAHPGERLPPHRWEQAVTLARVLPRSYVAQH